MIIEIGGKKYRTYDKIHLFYSNGRQVKDENILKEFRGMIW